MITFWGAVGIAVGLWFATGWYLNERLKRVHEKLDLVLDNFNGLREYLYEIDPQFDEERDLMTELWASVENDNMSFAGMHHMDLTKEKEKQGFRTLHTTFLDGGHRAPNR
ncbi:MAG TPA: hypothetical protein VM657_11555 [Sphingomonas sp.]|nr:hypothetical protein [Sphingomonas sp.]